MPDTFGKKPRSKPKGLLIKLRRLGVRLLAPTRRIVLPGFEGQSLYQVGKLFVEGLTNNSAATRAASVTFRFLLAMFPLIICIFSLIPFVPIENFQANILISIQQFFPPEVYSFFEDFLVDLIARKRSIIVSIGFLFTLYFASNGINALLWAFTSSTNLREKRPALKQQLWAVGLLFVFFTFSILITLISGFGQMILNYLFEQEIISGGISYFLLTLLKMGMSVALYYCSIALMYNIGNTDRKKWRLFSAGATMATLFILLLQEGFSLYLTYFGKFDKVYGHLGAALAFLLFFYYLFLSLIIGFELNTSIQGARRLREKT